MIERGRERERKKCERGGERERGEKKVERNGRGILMDREIYRRRKRDNS